jgi:hypothetical protein
MTGYFIHLWRLGGKFSSGQGGAWMRTYWGARHLRPYRLGYGASRRFVADPKSALNNSLPTEAPSLNHVDSRTIVLICYHAATSTGQTSPIWTHFECVLLGGFLWAWVV